ncbi:MAG TPA: hypothetical protein VF471_13790 [Pseudoxanthomonas sp.]
MAAEQTSDAVTGMTAFQEAFGRITQDKGEALAEYEKLQAIYRQMEDKERAQAAQLLSMTDAMFGRYQDATDHYYTAFPAGKKPVSCPASGVTPEPALAAVRKLASDAQVAMINESHSIATTRAFVYQLLPVLRQLGFKYLAMEALAPASDDLTQNLPMKSLRDIALPSRGYPLDESSAGFYLREPIYAELVREAIAQGFTLVAYETLQAKSRDEREEGQANALARLVASDPQAKIAVIAGYSHIWKADGWMAERLQKQISGKILSIDQTSGVLGCDQPLKTSSLEPYILTGADGKGWASKPDRVDVTVLHPAYEYGRTAPSGWLTLGGRRQGVAPDTAACDDSWPCLVSAVYASEGEEAVPADRVLLASADDPSLLFLKPGTYRYVVEPRGRPKSTRELTIP